MGSCVSTNATTQSEQVQPIGAGVAGPDPKAVNNRAPANNNAQPGSGRKKADPPATQANLNRPEDELYPGLTEALSNLPTIVKQHTHKDRTFFLSCVAKKSTTTLEFGAFDVTLGHIYSKEYTDKELVAGPLKSTTVDTVLQQVEAQIRAGSLKMSTGEREMALSFVVDPKNPTNRTWKVILEKKRSGDSSAFHRLFLEPLLQYLAKARQEKEAKDTNVRDKELKHNAIRCSNGESSEACKALEEEVEPLKKQNASGKARQLELQAKIDNLQKRIFKLKNPNACGPELYAAGPKKYMLHTPYSPNHEPVRIEPNKVATQMVKMHFAKGKDVGLGMEPMEASLKQLLDSAPDNSHDTIMQIMKRVDDWDFDVFALAKQTNGGALFMATFALLHKYGLVSHFNLDEEVLMNFLLGVESGYHPNPYHNAVHAADVLQVTHYIIGPGGMKETLKLTPEDCLAGLLSACVHDYDHPGFNNNFHIRTNAYLATLYNDRSVLENHHCASVFEMMKDERYNVLKSLTEEQRKDVRDTMVEMILSTDMGNHTKIFSSFKRRLQDDAEWTKKDDIRLALSIAIKMADVSNCSRPHVLYKQWAERIAQEFYNQGDVEARLRLNISPFMDRRKHDTDFAKGQVSFMNYIVIPLFEAGAELLPNLEFTVSKIQENKESYVDAM